MLRQVEQVPQQASSQSTIRKGLIEMVAIAAVSYDELSFGGEPVVRHQYSIRGGGHNGVIRLWAAIKEDACQAKFLECGYRLVRILNGEGDIVKDGCVWAEVLLEKEGKEERMMVKAVPKQNHMMELQAHPM